MGRKKLVEIFNKKHYINTVEKTLGIIQKQRENPSNTNTVAKTVNKIVKNYEKQPKHY